MLDSLGISPNKKIRSSGKKQSMRSSTFEVDAFACRMNREFKKLRRQLQRKRHNKIELCVKLSLLRLFHVDHFVQNRRTALSLAW